ncbi:MAG: SurA N-terminal domain-containing protein [Deltaproteobacteria bacterium]|nr:SurA N-terminal domain-containing protein [Deltaproteobacteria bacterium]
MLKILRQKAGSWMVKAILGVIIIVFVFWGVGSYNSKKDNVIAVVNGEKITINEYRETYENLLSQFRKRFGNNLNDEMIKMLRIKRQTVNMLIDRKLLINAAEKLKLRVTQDEVVSEIKKFPAFQTAGTFDKRLYSSILNRIRTTPEKFESEQSVSLLLNKLRLFITDCVKVPEEEAREWFVRNNLAIKIDYVLFDPATYKGINPSDKEASDYFEIHKEEYKTEPEVKVRYLRFDPENYKSEVNISNQEIQDYYDANPDEFIEPETVEARHILLKTGQNVSPEMVEAQRKKALEILAMAKKENNFAELAKQYSEGPSKNNGGFLGAFRKKDMVKPFAEKAFSMKPGEISDPVQTRFGWHIIKVEKVTPESTTPFEKAAIKIQAEITKERALNLAYDEAESVYSASFGGDDLITAAREHNIKVKTTDFFTKQGPEKGISDRSKFASAAFALQKMDISDIVDCKNSYYVLQLIEKNPSRIHEFSAVQEKVISALIKKKQKEKAEQDAQALLDDLKSGVLISSGAEKYNLKSSTSDFFKRNDLPKNSGLEESIIKVSFQLSEKHKLPEHLIEGIRGYYVIEFNDNKKADPDEFNDNKETIRTKILEEKKNHTFETYLAQLRKRSEISIENNFLGNE